MIMIHIYTRREKTQKTLGYSTVHVAINNRMPATLQVYMGENLCSLSCIAREGNYLILLGPSQARDW